MCVFLGLGVVLGFAVKISQLSRDPKRLRSRVTSFCNPIGQPVAFLLVSRAIC